MASARLKSTFGQKNVTFGQQKKYLQVIEISDFWLYYSVNLCYIINLDSDKLFTTRHLF